MSFLTEFGEACREDLGGDDSVPHVRYWHLADMRHA